MKIINALKVIILHSVFISDLKISIPIIFERVGCNNEEYLKEMGDLIVFNSFFFFENFI